MKLNRLIHPDGGEVLVAESGVKALTERGYKPAKDPKPAKKEAKDAREQESEAS